MHHRYSHSHSLSHGKTLFPRDKSFAGEFGRLPWRASGSKQASILAYMPKPPKRAFDDDEYREPPSPTARFPRLHRKRNKRSAHRREAQRRYGVNIDSDDDYQTTDDERTETDVDDDEEVYRQIYSRHEERGDDEEGADGEQDYDDEGEGDGEGDVPELQLEERKREDVDHPQWKREDADHPQWKRGDVDHPSQQASRKHPVGCVAG